MKITAINHMTIPHKNRELFAKDVVISIVAGGYECTAVWITEHPEKCYSFTVAAEIAKAGTSRRVSYLFDESTDEQECARVLISLLPTAAGLTEIQKKFGEGISVSMARKLEDLGYGQS